MMELSENELKLQRAQTVANFKTVFLKTIQGPDVLRELASYCMLDQSTFSQDPYITAFNEGKRDVMLHLLQMMHVDIHAFLSDNMKEEDFV